MTAGSGSSGAFNGNVAQQRLAHAPGFELPNDLVREGRDLVLLCEVPRGAHGDQIEQERRQDDHPQREPHFWKRGRVCTPHGHGEPEAPQQRERHAQQQVTGAGEIEDGGVKVEQGVDMLERDEVQRPFEEADEYHVGEQQDDGDHRQHDEQP
jgi:hypothetical protein